MAGSFLRGAAVRAVVTPISVAARARRHARLESGPSAWVERMNSRDDDLELLPASGFTVRELADLYNRTRVDYLVPMPMNAARLSSYIDRLDVDLGSSLVAVVAQRPVGLGLLGVRDQRGWITRLGVAPTCRLHGVGAALTEGLLTAATTHGIGLVTLEVIKGNTTAAQMFQRFGFRAARELLILERPRQAAPAAASGAVSPMARRELSSLLGDTDSVCPWTAQSETLRSLVGLTGLRGSTGAGDHGWLIYARRDTTLICLACGTDAGRPGAVTRQLLAHLHRAHPDATAGFENVPVDDPHVGGFASAGYVEVFRRVEMRRFDSRSEVAGRGATLRQRAGSPARDDARGGLVYARRCG